ncbi:MAG TPA: hypothetical protein VL068_03175, partial [Microthrixaceae bacterium]|nr:hypothetical protein [Microthrixaceae bacterium]
MSGFHELGDEFAGDDANDEWDATWAAYAAGSQPDIDSGHLPLRASLTLPIGRVDVRGDDPGIELCLFQPLAVLDLQDHVESEFDEEGDYVSALTLTLRADDSGRIDYEVTDNRGEQKDSGSLDDSGSASELLDYLIDASVRADSTHGYLNAACVEVDGRGVLIFSDDPTVRDSVAKALIAAGADYLTDSVVATNPGTRSVGGLRRRRLGANEARTIDRVLVEAVILVDAEADRIAELDFADDRIELMEAVVELARFIHQGTNSHSLAVTHLAELLAGASCHRMNPADVGRLGDVLASASGLGANAMRELVVVSELPSEA